MHIWHNMEVEFLTKDFKRRFPDVLVTVLPMTQPVFRQRLTQAEKISLGPHIYAIIQAVLHAITLFMWTAPKETRVILT